MEDGDVGEGLGPPGDDDLRMELAIFTRPVAVFDRLMATSFSAMLLEWRMGTLERDSAPPAMTICAWSWRFSRVRSPSSTGSWRPAFPPCSLNGGWGRWRGTRPPRR